MKGLRKTIKRSVNPNPRKVSKIETTTDKDISKLAAEEIKIVSDKIQEKVDKILNQKKEPEEVITEKKKNKKKNYIKDPTEE